MNKSIQLLLVCAMVSLTSCASRKAVVNDSVKTTTNQSVAASNDAATQQLAFIQQVSDQNVYAQNIVASLSFTAKAGDKDITVPGRLHMRKDKVIRLQLFIPLLGSEVGRLEFTPDYVLVVDRMHKQYLKGDYNQLDFLRDNGLNFYSLQALFWNQLLLPGTTRVGEADLARFVADLTKAGQTVPVSLTNGNMNYTWDADRTTGTINRATVTYQSKKDGKSTLVWNYSNFKPVGAKHFPAKQEFTFTTNATRKPQTATVTLDMDAPKQSADWEERTTVSSKYKQMDAQDVLSKILSM